MADFRQDLTDRIITELEAGTAPWQKPWDGSVAQSLQPFNPVSGTQYRGGNRLWLTMQGYDDPRWCTYKQAAAQGWQVRKGEKSALIEFWKWSNEVERVNEETGEIEKLQVRRDTPIVRFANVFNASQIDNVPVLERVSGGYEWESLQMAETIINRSGVPFLFDTVDRAYYRPSTDQIHMPAREAFPSASQFYATALHELGHASGHASRLGRDLSGDFGSADYAKEELRAELASYFLSARLGIEFDVGHHAAYVSSWIKVLKEDKNEIFRASRDAEGISEYVMNIGLDKTLQPYTATRDASVPVDVALAEFPTSEKPAPVASAGRT
jgi:putative DNA primase/helicase